MYAAFNLVSVVVGKELDEFYQRFLTTIAFGMTMGLLFSFYGRFVKRMPTKIFGKTKKNAWTIHFQALALYAVIFSIVGLLNEATIKFKD